MKKWGLFILMMAVLFTFAACTPPQSPEKNTGNSSENPNQGSDSDIVAEEKTTVKLYYANQDYVNTGDESLDKVIPVKKEVALEGKKVEEFIVEELQKSPEDEKLSTSLGEINILGVKLSDDTASVDFSSENLHGGSLEEVLILHQIVFSLTELPNIKQVQILVDGEKQETLMGHIEITNPLKRSDISF